MGPSLGNFKLNFKKYTATQLKNPNSANSIFNLRNSSKDNLQIIGKQNVTKNYSYEKNIVNEGPGFVDILKQKMDNNNKSTSKESESTSEVTSKESESTSEVTSKESESTSEVISEKINKEQKTSELINSIKEEVLNEEGNGPRKYIDWYYGEGSGVVDWCAIFVNWIFNHDGDSGLYATHGEGNAVAGEDIKTAIAEGRGKWFESEYTDSSTTPQPGDVVTFNWVSSDGQLTNGYDEDGNLQQWKYQTPQGRDHVGYGYDVDDEYIYTIEGNANSYEASAATVTTKKWSRTDININGYYRPNYENGVS